MRKPARACGATAGDAAERVGQEARHRRAPARSAKCARRAAGFDIEIGYHNRSEKNVPYRYFDRVDTLAQWADFLIVATPGGAGTRHLIDRAVLDALGPGGFVVNVSRGSVVDTAALADALREGRIAGAGPTCTKANPSRRAR